MIRRREFPKPVRRAAYARSNGICECHRLAGFPGFIKGGCGRKLGPGDTFYEHIVCDGVGGAPTLDNCAVLTKTCWRIKTDSFDRRVVAKAKRQRDREIGISRRIHVPVPGSRNTPFLKRISGWTEWRR